MRKAKSGKDLEPGASEKIPDEDVRFSAIFGLQRFPLINFCELNCDVTILMKNRKMRSFLDF